MSKTKMGRPTLFKKDGPDVHGRISKKAGIAFERLRKRLARREGWPVEKVSDGDVVEFIIETSAEG